MKMSKNTNQQSSFGKSKDERNSSPNRTKLSGGTNSHSTITESPPSSSSSSSSQKEMWPQSLKELVTSIFNKAGDRKKEVSDILRKYIEQVKQRNEIFTTDWSNVVIPGLEEFTRKKRLFSEVQIGVKGDDFSSNLWQHQAGKVLKSTSDWKSPKNVANDMKPDYIPVAYPPKSDLKWKTKFTPETKSSSLGSGQLPISKKFSKLSEPINRGASITSLSESVDSFAGSDQPVVGTCQRIEKRYLRLTSAPDPSTVRPENILKQSIEFLKSKWASDKDYGYMCDQLKAVRQDLTVQMIKNEFTVNVYELHARIALEKKDLGEYNQCQAQLQQLYALGIPGHEYEFMAYRLLYFIFTKNKTGISQFLRTLRSRHRKDHAIRQALDVRTAVASNNYHRLKHLYLNALNMNSYLMDHFMERERVKALQMMTKSYRPTLDLNFVASELGFVTKNDYEEAFPDVDECRKFIEKFTEGGENLVSAQESSSSLDCKLAYPFFVKAASAYVKVDIKGQI